MKDFVANTNSVNNNQEYSSNVDSKEEAQRSVQKKSKNSLSAFQVAQFRVKEEEKPDSGEIDPISRFHSLKSANGSDTSIQRKTNSQENSNHTGLPDNLKSGIENLSGYSMDDVNVHYNSSKPAEMNAHAYAQGTDIHVASGQEQHLPHEAWHVVQQKQGRVSPTIQLKEKVNINDNEGLETEADEMGERALQHFNVSSAPDDVKGITNGSFIGDTIQRELAVQIIKQSDFENLIKDVAIQGRPEGVLHGEEGSHTTAWVVSTEGVRNAVIGKTHQKAIAGVLQLINIAFEMPGYKRIQNQTFGKEEKFQKLEINLRTSMKTVLSDSGILSIQKLIEDYLSFRNALPLSAVKLGSTADGKGESKWIKVLYDWEMQDPKVLQEAFLSLIDYDAIMGFENATSRHTDTVLEEDSMHQGLEDSSEIVIEKVKTRDTFLDAPGVTEKDHRSEKVKADVIIQHLKSVAGSFPEAYDKSGLSEDSVGKIFTKIRGYDELHKKQKEEKTTVKYPVVKNAPPKLKTAVQVDMGKGFDYFFDIDTKAIQKIKIEGRPRGVFGSGEKSHVTAWSVIEQGPVTACVGKTLPKAFEAMQHLSHQALELPQGEMDTALPLQQKVEFKEASRMLVGYIKSKNYTVNELQQFIVGYLNFKNLLPFSAVDLGKKADGHGEAIRLNILRNHDLNSKETIQGAIWGLLDRETMVAIGIGTSTKTVLVKTKEEVYQQLFEKASQQAKSSGRRSSRSSQEFRDLPKFDSVKPEYGEVPENAEDTHKRLPGVPHSSEYADGEESYDKANRVGMVVGNHLKNIKISFPKAYEKAQISMDDVKNYVAYDLFKDKGGYQSIAPHIASVLRRFL